MAEFFNAADVTAAAIRIEQRGQDVYRQAVAMAIKPEVKALFEHLAAEEAKHEATFRAMADRIGPVELPAWSIAAEYVEYLHALLDSHALFTQTGTLTSLKGAADDHAAALRMAIQFEKDTLLFFTEMRDLVPASEKATVDACIAEERAHLRALTAMLAQAAQS
ncbi:ferritin family protein [Nitratidesulfovibrio sp. HK-II]|uniref:ferritin-like domain-containing protein n=1 Tax=Nitratidesulfovibrio sp. HK-II TaxID=2009266 RepID=UPI000E2F1C5A|nr:ferritin family protein [Nitratidesulfovibrio sp. HK-II]GBO95973.1 rubrerythrin [Nitratidesulfovibrio sp. HK-II]